MAAAGQWTYSKSYYDPESGSNLDGFELAGVQGHFKAMKQGTDRKSDTGIFFLTVAITFEVQVAGSIGVLSNGA